MGVGAKNRQSLYPIGRIVLFPIQDLEPEELPGFVSHGEERILLICVWWPFETMSRVTRGYDDAIDGADLHVDIPLLEHAAWDIIAPTNIFRRMRKS